MRDAFLQKADEVALWSRRPELWANEIALLRAGAESRSAWEVAGVSRLRDPWVWLYGLRTHNSNIDSLAASSDPANLPLIVERATRKYLGSLVELADGRDVQTNEPRRARYVRLVIQHLGLGGNKHISVELGTSAGLVPRQSAVPGGTAIGMDRRPLDMRDPLHREYLIAHTQPGSPARRRVTTCVRSALTTEGFEPVIKGSTYEDVEHLDHSVRRKLELDDDVPLLVYQCRIGEIVDPSGLASFLKASRPRHVVMIETAGDLRALNDPLIEQIDRKTDGNAAVAVEVRPNGLTDVLAAGDIDARRVIPASAIDTRGDLAGQLLGPSVAEGFAR